LHAVCFLSFIDLVLLPGEGFTQGSFTSFGRRRQGSVE